LAKRSLPLKISVFAWLDIWGEGLIALGGPERLQ